MAYIYWAPVYYLIKSLQQTYKTGSIIIPI